jgi:hypothetical protein
VTGLSSGIAPVALSPEQLPEYAPHHEAKHKLVREYANVWLPKLRFSYPQVALVDGYASAGRYRGGQLGSPLILLHAYLGRNDHDRFQSPPHFVFCGLSSPLEPNLLGEADPGSQLDLVTLRQRPLGVVLEIDLDDWLRVVVTPRARGSAPA